MRLDFVVRQEVPIVGVTAELNLEVRNIFGTDYREFQRFGANRVFINAYDVGTQFSFGATLRF